MMEQLVLIRGGDSVTEAELGSGVEVLPDVAKSFKALGVKVQEVDLSCDMGDLASSHSLLSRGIVIYSGSHIDKVLRRLEDWRSSGLKSLCAVIVPDDVLQQAGDLLNAGADRVLASSAGHEDIVLAFDGLERLWKKRLTEQQEETSVNSGEHEQHEDTMSYTSSVSSLSGKPNGMRNSIDEQQSDDLVFEDLALSRHRRLMKVCGKPAHVTSKEYDLLRLLMGQPEHVFSKEAIHRHLYPQRKKPDMRIIDVYVCKLRRRLADLSDGCHYIQTEWGRGYVLSKVVLENSFRQSSQEVDAQS